MGQLEIYFILGNESYQISIYVCRSLLGGCATVGAVCAYAVCTRASVCVRAVRSDNCRRTSRYAARVDGASVLRLCIALDELVERRADACADAVAMQNRSVEAYRDVIKPTQTPHITTTEP